VATKPWVSRFKPHLADAMRDNWVKGELWLAVSSSYPLARCVCAWKRDDVTLRRNAVDSLEARIGNWNALSRKAETIESRDGRRKWRKKRTFTRFSAQQSAFGVYLLYSASESSFVVTISRLLLLLRRHHQKNRRRVKTRSECNFPREQKAMRVVFRHLYHAMRDTRPVYLRV